MKAEDKAWELVDKFKDELYDSYTPYDTLLNSAKQCALICVDEIELYRKQIEGEYDEDLYHAYGVEEYWQEVKEHIKQM